jgi:hypothetical protein
MPAIGLELTIGGDVVAEQDLVGEAALKQLDDDLDQPRLAVLANGIPGHSEEVELDVCTAVEDRKVVIEGWHRIGVADDHAGRIQRLLLKNAELLKPDLGVERVGRQREAREAGGARGGTVDALLLGAHPPMVRADLADDPGPHPRIGNSVLEFGNDLRRQVRDAAAVDPRLGRVPALAVPAGAHHDEDAAPRRQVPQPERIATKSAARDIDEAAATTASEVVQLLKDQLRV